MIDASNYRPSMQVKHVIFMIVTERQGMYQRGKMRSTSNDENRHIGFRHALNCVLRELVELETEITDPDDLDQVCGDLIEDAHASLG